MMLSPGARSRRIGIRLVAVACVIAVAMVAVWFVFYRGDDSRRVVADFAHIEGVHPGSDVAVLGVPLGRVESVTPRGGRVRVAMSLRGDVRLPSGVEAYVMNPSVIGSRYVELGPVYRGGDEYGDGQVIPVERTHSPINWDELLGSVDTIASALAPGAGDVGGAIDRAAEATAGLGPELHGAIENIGSATSVIGARTGDIGALLEDLDRIAAAFGARDGRVAETVHALARLGDEIERQDLDVGTPVSRLRDLLDRFDALVRDRSDDLDAVIGGARSVMDDLAARPAGLAEVMDLVPLVMQNVDNTIGEDQRSRIRLDVATNGAQFASAEQLCREHPGPLCLGAGLTNPIPVPIGLSDPLGLSALRAGDTPWPQDAGGTEGGGR